MTTTADKPAQAPSYLSPKERAARGKALRSEASRASHANWGPPSDRPDPIALLEEQAAQRVPELVPIRYGRMSASPFAFYRGAAYVMASDLAGTAHSGIRVQLCGDAHLANFGGFASPERELLFDLNDFDETLPGPWEWDIKRLAASVAVAGRENGFPVKRRRAMVRQAAGQYRSAMREFAGMKTLDIWYARMDAGALAELLQAEGSTGEAKRFDRTVGKGLRKDSARAFEKLAATVNGDARIVPDPPLIVPVEELLDGAQAQRLEQEIQSMLRSYRTTLSGDRRRLLERYRYADLARKVVGVGSVGTRAWVVLLLGRDVSDPLFIQAKEADRSVLEPFTAKSAYNNQGQRVVEGQRLMQAASDILLGWLRATLPDDDGPRDFYLRQLWDWKTSADIGQMQVTELAHYARLCAWTLARAHARSGDAIAIAAYLGSSEEFDKAIAEFAEAYADQNETDYAALLQAIDSGRVEAQTGV